MSKFDKKYEQYGTGRETNPWANNTIFDVIPEGGVS